MSQLLDERRPGWVKVPDVEPPAESQRAVTLLLTGDGTEEIAFHARFGDEQWFHAAPLGELERFLHDAEDGIASSFQLGDELAVIGPGAEDVSVAIGPYDVSGTVTDWRAVIERERLERVPELEVPAGALASVHHGDRIGFPVTDTD